MFPVNNIYPQKVVAILNTIGREIFHVKKSLQNHGNNDNIEYLFPEHVHKKYDN